MRILFDQGTPLPLRKYLGDHIVATAYEMGWNELENGELLAAAESEGFNVLITTDQNLRCQQNLTSRTIAIVVVLTTNWPRIERSVSLVAEAVREISVGGYVEVSFPTK